MSQNLQPPIPLLVPETAPFSEEQRAWLNGFFAGLVSLDGQGVTALSPDQAAALLAGGPAPVTTAYFALRRRPSISAWPARRAPDMP